MAGKANKAKGGKGARAEAGPGEKLKRKDYDKELAKRHVELVKLQQWVQKEGRKVCIVFEGRDGAGKGTTRAARTSRPASSRDQCSIGSSGRRAGSSTSIPAEALRRSV